MRFGSKVPGSQMEVRDVTMDFGYGTAFTEASPEAYERLILDVLLGEPSLFPVNAEVERSWEILDPVLEHWATQPHGARPLPGRQLGAGVGERRCSRAPDARGGGRDRSDPSLTEASMIVDLPSSTVSDGQQEARRAAREGGVLALGRVLTLVIITDDGSAIEEAIEAGELGQPRAPVPGDRAGPRPDAGRRRASTRRSGSAATPGASDVIVLRGYGPLAADEAGAGMVMPLLLPDAPVVAWWPSEAPAVPSADAGRPAGAASDHRRAVVEEPDQGVRAAPRQLRRRGHRPRLDPAHAVARAAGRRAGFAAARPGHQRRSSRVRRSRRRPT